MTNHARRPGAIPAAFSPTGKEVPPSPDVAEHSLAQVIGQSVALHLAQLLAPGIEQLIKVASQVQPQPACVLCVQECKQAEAAWQVAAQNAMQAAEPEPAPFAAPPIAQAVTWMPIGQPPVAVPLCYGHVPSGPQVRATGLVAPNGQPIVAQRA